MHFKGHTASTLILHVLGELMHVLESQKGWEDDGEGKGLGRRRKAGEG
jgi:hypothetical protein